MFNVHSPKILQLKTTVMKQGSGAEMCVAIHDRSFNNIISLKQTTMGKKMLELFIYYFYFQDLSMLRRKSYHNWKCTIRNQLGASLSVSLFSIQGKHNTALGKQV